MPIAGRARGAPVSAVLLAPSLVGLLLPALFAGLLTACTRASAAALLPRVSLGVLAKHAVRATNSDGFAADRWQVLAQIALEFRPRSVAAELPLRAELMPETWIAPCDAEDFICLEEAAEAEQELRAALGELQ